MEGEHHSLCGDRYLFVFSNDGKLVGELQVHTLFPTHPFGYAAHLHWFIAGRLYRLRRDVREMTSTGDFYSRVPGWVHHEDLLHWNRENDPVILKKVQARNERLAAKAEEESR